jgi:PST family polysaccharide transporter
MLETTVLRYSNSDQENGTLPPRGSIDEKSNEASETYEQIFKSTSIIGASQATSILMKVAQAKILAYFVGPAGIALFGLFNSITGTVGMLAGMGITNSGVRQIAEAVACGDQVRITRSIVTLRRLAPFFGALGTAILFLFRKNVCQLTFGHTGYSDSLALLSLVVFFTAVSGGQTALLQGMRRVPDLAKVTIMGSIGGAVLSFPFLYFWKARGIAPLIVAAAGMTIFSSWWRARKVYVTKIRIPPSELLTEAKGLLRLGIVFMGSGVVTVGVIYLVRVLITREFGLRATGLYEASYTLSNVYVSYVLSAMTADFYPRLTGVSEQNIVATRVVNEQIEVGLLLTMPGLLALMAMAPFILSLLYSPEFVLAYDILRWQMLGTFLRVITWPLGFIQLAKGRGKIFLLTEIASNAILVISMWLGIKYFGLPGAGMAFFVLYILHFIMTYFVARHLIDFRWSRTNLHLFIVCVPVVVSVFIAQAAFPSSFSVGLGCVAAVAMAAYSMKTLYALVGPTKIQTLARKIVCLTRFSKV